MQCKIYSIFLTLQTSRKHFEKGGGIKIALTGEGLEGEASHADAPSEGWVGGFASLFLMNILRVRRRTIPRKSLSWMRQLIRSSKRL